MANPAFVTCTLETWVLVATNVNTGILWRESTAPTQYLYTYVTTGGAAPTLAGEGVPIFLDGEPTYEQIDGSGIDIYLYAVGAAGTVRVDV